MFKIALPFYKDLYIVASVCNLYSSTTNIVALYLLLRYYSTVIDQANEVTHSVAFLIIVLCYVMLVQLFPPRLHTTPHIRLPVYLGVIMFIRQLRNRRLPFPSYSTPLHPQQVSAPAVPGSRPIPSSVRQTLPSYSDQLLYILTLSIFISLFIF